jgi:hypothetical protein
MTCLVACLRAGISPANAIVVAMGAHPSHHQVQVTRVKGPLRMTAVEGVSWWHALHASRDSGTTLGAHNRQKASFPAPQKSIKVFNISTYVMIESRSLKQAFVESPSVMR